MPRLAGRPYRESLLLRHQAVLLLVSGIQLNGFHHEHRATGHCVRGNLGALGLSAGGGGRRRVGGVTPKPGSAPNVGV